ncbi:MAG TPA: zinc ribbon domain-containing protein [Firmicutes bacterium]|nr:zinc ribbon domain-containing protein [Bacillota bacterium]
MPIYEFSCPECKHKFEELCKCNTESIPCPKCGATQTKRLFSAFGFAVSGGSSSSGSAASGCGSCSGGNCSTCH